METEVQNQLILAIKWPELRKHLHLLFESPECLADCIPANLDGLSMMAKMLRSENSLDQLYGLTDLLLEELENSTMPNKYTKFCKIISEKTNQGHVIKLNHTSQEKIFFHFLAKFYLGQWPSALNANKFDLLASDELVVSLLATNAILEGGMGIIQKSGCKKDIALLSALFTRKDWVPRLIAGLVQSDSLVRLEQLLPGFQSTFLANFDTPWANLRNQLSAEDSSTRQSARGTIGECLDLYFCLAWSSDVSMSDVSPAAAAAPLSPPAATAPSLSPRHARTPLDLIASAKKARVEPLELSSVLASGREVADDDEAESVDIGRQQMRAYQRELASAGIAGLNCVIVAPTGSGKTLVSVEIAAARLANDPDGAKVCFLADRKHLVEQQYAAFREQLPPRFRHKISCHTGGEGDRAPLKFCLQENSVLIVSTQILLNSLRDTSEDGLNGDVSQFSLIVFDECHHCDKDHPSRKIMECYFRFRESNPGRQLPQIIGLTASPGTGQANRTAEAKQHLLKLCANLDCRRLVTVRKCLESLGDHVTDPSFKLHHTPRKDSDSVLECLDRLMDEAEAGLLDIYQAKSLHSLPRPPMRSSFLYTNFCGDLRAKAFEQAAAAAAAVEVMAAWKYLHYCNVAMLLRSLFRSADALKYLDQHLGDVNVMGRSPTCSLDDRLRKLFNQLLPTMQQFVKSQPALANCSPSLEALRGILVEQFCRDPDSRVLVFVQQRCFTTAVKDYLDAEPAVELTRAGARTGVMTGTNAPGETGGSTQTDQSGLLAQFRRGTIKILISTSVSEEGIDVQKCNSVVRFCHVTNEIAMVQSRGRGRAEGSAYHVIVPEEFSWLSQKEQVNRARDAMMQEALKQLSDLPERDFEKAMKSVQDEQRADAAEKRAIQARQQAANQGSVYNLLCSSCGVRLTSSTNLRTAQNCHHFALDASLLRDRLEARQECAPKAFKDYNMLGIALVHRNCGNKIGILCRYKEQVYPEISISGVVFEAVRTKARNGPLKQWKLAAKFLTVEEISAQDRKAWASQVPDIPDNLRQPEPMDANSDAD